jgi:hypothetical protein
MSMGEIGIVPDDTFVSKIEVIKQWWVLIPLAIMISAILSHVLWFINFVHVFGGILWTGTDLFMGFMIGPIMRRITVQARREVILRLMPKMLFYMPLLAIITTTAGWYMAEWLGFFTLPFPTAWWLAAAFTIVGILTIQGLGILLPTNLKIYFEMRKEKPDGQRIQRLMKTYVRVVAIQGIMQVGIIVIMSRFATGV